MKIRMAKIRGIHPYSFRSGHWAKIIGVKMITPDNGVERPCFEIKFLDGTIDYIPISETPHYEIMGGVIND